MFYVFLQLNTTTQEADSNYTIRLVYNDMSERYISDIQSANLTSDCTCKSMRFKSNIIQLEDI